jgi:hypothetical protein
MNTPLERAGHHEMKIWWMSRLRRPARTASAAAVAVALGLALSACIAAGPASDDSGFEGIHSSPTPATAPVDVPSGAPADSATSDAAPSPGVDASAANASTGAGSAPAGCPGNGATIPVGADTSPIEDVDGDGQADTQFFSEESTFTYGISTATGATISLHSPLAGPNTHSGWSARLNKDLVITVIDDGRSARLYSFVNCEFHETTAPDGGRITLYLNGFGANNTGVQCSDVDGARSIDAVSATQRETGRYAISLRPIAFSSDGTTATFAAPSDAAWNLDPTDPRIPVAMTSSCTGVPKVATSGR